MTGAAWTVLGGYALLVLAVVGLVGEVIAHAMRGLS